MFHEKVMDQIQFQLTLQQAPTYLRELDLVNYLPAFQVPLSYMMTGDSLRSTMRIQQKILQPRVILYCGDHEKCVDIRD